MEITEMLLELNPSDKRGVKICIQVVTQPAYGIRVQVQCVPSFVVLLYPSRISQKSLRAEGKR